ncbi:MAG: glycoside hydrolase family 3 protein [Patescibacteria group bacterium]
MKSLLSFGVWRTLLLLIGGAVVIMGLFVVRNSMLENNVPPLSTKYLDTSLPVETRIQDLVAQMTLKEKIGQMALVEKNSLTNPSDIATYGLGAVLSGAGAKPEQNTADGWRTMIESFQTQAQSNRLKIPILYGVDAVHGHALLPGTVVFPHQIALGATGDATLVKQIAQVTARDLQMVGANWNYAPNLDLPRDIRWGRVYEAYSDDPLLAARLGSAYVEGLQTYPQANSETMPVLATLKHFVGVGAMQWKTSTNKNFSIDQGKTNDDIEHLEKQYLPPFKSAINAGALSVMVGLNEWGNNRLIRNKSILTGELKTELGFMGFVVSDWYGVYEGVLNKFIASTRAINAGVDMVMLPFDYKTFIKHVTWAHRFGLISTARIDDAVTRIMRAKFALGMFDGIDSREAVVPSLASDQALARTAVAQSLVLLKNTNDVLPLSKTTRHIRVAGSAADNVGRQSGAWTVEWQGVDGNVLTPGTSILQGIKDAVSPQTILEYSLMGEYKTAGQKADVGIAVVGEVPYAEGWGDREYPILSNEDLKTIQNLQANSNQVVVIIVSGRPLLISNEVDSWDALVAAWLPGSEGAGVSDVLFGDKLFMGTLPLPWPKTAEQLPIDVNGITADGTPVLFPRYAGLSY